MNIIHRKAKLDDLKEIVSLLADDNLGSLREQDISTPAFNVISTGNNKLDPRYIDAFAKIDSDPNQYLMVLENDGELIGTCHLTLMPSLTFTGSTRLQIEAVRVHRKFRRKNVNKSETNSNNLRTQSDDIIKAQDAPYEPYRIGQKMIESAINWGKDHGATIIQLTTNKKRPDALRFYEKLGFKASHEGMKLYLYN